MTSPYDGVPEEQWVNVTEKLLNQHPLSRETVLDTALLAWKRLWSTKVGDGGAGFALSELDVPATVVGYFFEKLFAKELSRLFPDVWEGGKGVQKDLHCKVDDLMSVEIKTSGQPGTKIFGNRSYGQKVESENQKKDKSGYYITVNFCRQTLTLIRFGWIDADDWQAQKSPTGQMAGLKEAVYKYKLRVIVGSYMLDAPVSNLTQIGPRAATELFRNGIYTIKDLVLAREDVLPERYRKIAAGARARYEGLF